MSRIEPTAELIEDILAHIPEGFIRYDMLCQRIRLNRASIAQLLGNHVAREGEYWYDAARLTPENLREVRKWARPQFPDMNAGGIFSEPSIKELMDARKQRLESSTDPAAARTVLAQVAHSLGYCKAESLHDQQKALDSLLAAGELRAFDGLIYDPLQLSQRSIKHIAAQEKFAPLKQQVIDYLHEQPGTTAAESELVERYGAYVIDTLLNSNVLKPLTISSEHNRTTTWLRPTDSDAQAAYDVATQTIQSTWDKLLAKCGQVLRPDAKDGKSARMQVLARSYTLNGAAIRLGIHQSALQKAIDEDRIEAFDDPDGHTRLPADAVEAAYNNPEYAEHITTFEQVHTHDLVVVLGVNYSSVRRRLQKIGIKRGEPRWGQIRGQLDLPDTYNEYRAILRARTEELRIKRAEVREQERRQLDEERRAERERRAALRAKLVAAFPTWQHEGRADQRIILHVGPPNSGKTHLALEALVEAGSGWYLAPLRLLAFEIFDRLNQRGAACNLLTGEEFMPVPDAAITAATVEMFNPHESGACVVIDEAQMLADADRGWAWTRALMEAQAAEIHVIGPQTVHGLIEQMANAAAIPLEIVKHERLAPIKIADTNWSLERLPERTILVAFSRALVLHLKTELERMRRTVSVVYGNLPPEVRRKQADRFANGETEICVATDAVGMGLNLPADYVCFYEVEKFDGRNVRVLTPAEVQQIGGRAGRYGLSTVGEVGATSKRDLKLLKKLFYEPAEILTHARVAPTVEDLELIPGNLASKLTQWSQLQSIPDGLRRAIQTADMTERIELASMLSDREVDLLGLEAALKIVNAPTRQNTRDYWYQCARHILTDKALPLPPVAPREITNTIELESIEYCIACADIYLWLSQRQEFGSFAPHAEEVRLMRTDWSVRIDGALLQKINTMKRCARCGKPLPLKHRYSICDNCFFGHTHETENEYD